MPRMLVINRRVGERIVIDTDIVVTILRVSGDYVSVGINLPEAMYTCAEGASLDTEKRKEGEPPKKDCC